MLTAFLTRHWNGQKVTWCCLWTEVWCLICTSPCSWQDVLLTQLGVSPYVVDPWPLTVLSRTLAVLAEVLLLRQQREREAGEVNVWSKAAVIPIWTRFLSTLKNVILHFDNNVEEFDGS